MFFFKKIHWNWHIFTFFTFVSDHRKSGNKFIVIIDEWDVLIRGEFADAVSENKWNEWIEFADQSNALLEATLDKNTKRIIEEYEK